MEPTQLAKVIAGTASIELQDKFIRGQREHGGDFMAKATIRNIREEVLDLINYSHVLIQHRSQVLIELDDLISNISSLDSFVIKLRLKSIRQQVHDL